MPKPPLSYSYPSFSSGDYDNHQTVISNIKSMGFDWITFTPTWMVKETDLPGFPPVLSIDESRTPPTTTIEAAVRFACEQKLNVKLEPHLDWEATLTGSAEDCILIQWLRTFNMTLK